MKLHNLTKAEAKNRIAAGVASAKAGRLSDGAAFFAELEADLAKDLRIENASEKRKRATNQ